MNNNYVLERINPRQLIFRRNDNKPLNELNYEYYDLYYDELKKIPYLTQDEVIWLMENVQINTFEDKSKILLIEADLVNRKTTDKDDKNSDYEIIEYKIFQRGGKEIDINCTISNLMAQNEDIYLAEKLSVIYDLNGKIVRIVLKIPKKREKKRLSSKQKKQILKLKKEMY